MTTPQHDPHILGLIQTEAAEHLEVMNSGLLALESSDAAQPGDLAEVLRAAHSLKGTSAAAGLVQVETLMHAFESCAVVLDRGEVTASPRAYDLLYRLLDGVECEVQAAVVGVRPGLEKPIPKAAELLEIFGVQLDLSQLEAQAEAEVSEPASAGEGGATLRVTTAKVDRLMANVEELVQLRSAGPQRLESVRDLGHLLEEVRLVVGELRTKTRALRSHGAESAVEAALEVLSGKVEEATAASDSMEASTRVQVKNLQALADRLQDDIRAVRMVPVQSAFGTMQRMVRDVGRKLGKRVSLEIEGGNVEIDRDLVEAVKDPVMHLLRNAVSHGVESPEERDAHGKSPAAIVRLRAEGHEGGFRLSVSDDGRGLDLKRVRARAVQMGLVAESDAASLSDRDVSTLIFAHGFSTAEVVDEVSGRGVGLDVVRKKVEGAGGSVALETNFGQGTCFTLSLPVSLSTVRLMLVQVARRLFAVPLATLVRIVRVDPKEVKKVDRGYALELDGRAVPIVRLGQLLGVDGSGSDTARHGLVINSGGERMALLVDAILGERELIMKGLGEHLVRVDMISGVTILASGEIVPVINVADVARSNASLAPHDLFASERGEVRLQRRVLIVDDSITTRTLEKSILEAVGYVVEVATDGQDALEKLSRASFDIVLSDVQMPRMDGIELVSRFKRTEGLRDTPFVLMSSLDTEDDRRRGLEAGADAYLGKNEFRQELLLETLERLL